MTHHFILLWLIPFDISDDDREGWWSEHSVS